jgi:hypothetical protein
MGFAGQCLINLIHAWDTTACSGSLMKLFVVLASILVILGHGSLVRGSCLHLLC